MKLKILSISPSSSTEIDISPESSVMDLKNLIVSKLGVPVAQQRLILQGKILKDNQNLKDFSGIDEGTTIHLVTRKITPTTPSTMNTTTSSGTTNVENNSVSSTLPSVSAETQERTPVAAPSGGMALFNNLRNLVNNSELNNPAGSARVMTMEIPVGIGAGGGAGGIDPTQITSIIENELRRQMPGLMSSGATSNVGSVSVRNLNLTSPDLAPIAIGLNGPAASTGESSATTNSTSTRNGSTAILAATPVDTSTTSDGMNARTTTNANTNANTNTNVPPVIRLSAPISSSESPIMNAVRLSQSYLDTARTLSHRYPFFNGSVSAPVSDLNAIGNHLITLPRQLQAVTDVITSTGNILLRENELEGAERRRAQDGIIHTKAIFLSLLKSMNGVMNLLEGVNLGESPGDVIIHHHVPATRGGVPHSSGTSSQPRRTNTRVNIAFQRHNNNAATASITNNSATDI